MTSRTVRGGVLALATVVAALAARPTASPQRALRERQVYATVLDRDGKPALGIGVRDFTVREDDVAREVLRVEPATSPMQVALLVDTSDRTQPDIPDIRKGLESFARAIFAKSPESQLSLVSFGERPTQEADYTANFATLQHSIQRLFAKPGSGSYLLEAILDATKALKKRQASRPVILAFSREDGPEFSNQSFQQVGDAVKDAGAELWAIVLQTRVQVAPVTDEERNRTVVLGDVTTKSGGTRDPILVRSALETKYVELAARLTSQYMVTYSRPEAIVPPERLEVTVKRDGLNVLAPRWAGK